VLCTSVTNSLTNNSTFSCTTLSFLSVNATKGATNNKSASIKIVMLEDFSKSLTDDQFAQYEEYCF
jgi:hypothetical protein